MVTFLQSVSFAFSIPVDACQSRFLITMLTRPHSISFSVCFYIATSDLPRPLDLGDSAARRTSSELPRVTAAMLDSASHPTVIVQA